MHFNIIENNVTCNSHNYYTIYYINGDIGKLVQFPHRVFRIFYVWENFQPVRNLCQGHIFPGFAGKQNILIYVCMFHFRSSFVAGNFWIHCPHWRQSTNHCPLSMDYSSHSDNWLMAEASISPGNCQLNEALATHRNLNWNYILPILNSNFRGNLAPGLYGNAT